MGHMPMANCVTPTAAAVRGPVAVPVFMAPSIVSLDGLVDRYNTQTKMLYEEYQREFNALQEKFERKRKAVDEDFERDRQSWVTSQITCIDVYINTKKRKFTPALMQ